MTANNEKILAVVGLVFCLVSLVLAAAYSQKESGHNIQMEIQEAEHNHQGVN